MIDHDTDSYEKIARAFVDGQPSGNLTREHIVDNITLYWLTGTGASAARSYWEEGQENAQRARRLRPSRFRSASPRSPGRSGGPRAAGSRGHTPTSSTSTRWTKAVTSPPGRNRSCSRKSCAPRSPPCDSASTKGGAPRCRPRAWQVMSFAMSVRPTVRTFSTPSRRPASPGATARHARRLTPPAAGPTHAGGWGLSVVDDQRISTTSSDAPSRPGVRLEPPRQCCRRSSGEHTQRTDPARRLLLVCAGVGLIVIGTHVADHYLKR